MPPEEVTRYLHDVPEWRLDADRIARDFRFRNFREALAFVNEVGRLAESEGHHPDILLYSWNRVRLTLTTHAIGGLSENDFVLAAKVDRISAGIRTSSGPVAQPQEPSR